MLFAKKKMHTLQKALSKTSHNIVRQQSEQERFMFNQYF